MSYVYPQLILVDANFLVAYCQLSPESDDFQRIRYFLECAESQGAKLIVPMPAMAEFLVRADTAAIDIVNNLERQRSVQLAPFDRAAAFECSLLDRAALGVDDKKDGSVEPWQKIKVDRQIIAIGKACGAKLVISGDQNVRSNALRVGMTAMTIDKLPLPEEAKQIKLALVMPIKEQ